MSFTHDEKECDQNGNFCFDLNSQKNSVWQIISEALRVAPGTDLNDLILESTVAAAKINNNNNNVHIQNETVASPTSESTLFNPGDKLSSPIPPLAAAAGQPSKLVADFLSVQGRDSCPAAPAAKDCHLTTVLCSARRCLKQLKVVKDGLGALLAKDERLSQGRKISSPCADYELMALLGEYTMYLTRQAFTPAHGLYTSALGLHMAEDLIRNPKDPQLLNFKSGYIVRPDWNTIIHTQMKLRNCVDAATEMYNRFGRDASKSCGHALQVEQMQHLMVTLMHAFQDLYATALGSTDIFKVLLHIEDYGEGILQEFLLSLESMERSDLLLQVQALRRSIDDVVIMIEQLTWASYVVYRLASGKSLTPSPDGSISRIPHATTSELRGNNNKDQDRANKPDSSSSARKYGMTSSSRSLLEPVSNNKPRSSRSKEYVRRERDEAESSDPNNNPEDRSSSRSKHSLDGRRSSSTTSNKSNSSSHHRRRVSENKDGKLLASKIPTPTGSPDSRSRRNSRTSVNNNNNNNAPDSSYRSGSHSYGSYSNGCPSGSRSSSRGSLNVGPPTATSKKQSSSYEQSQEKDYAHGSKSSKKSKSKSRSSSRESGLSTKHSSHHSSKSAHPEKVSSSYVSNKHKSKEREGSREESSSSARSHKSPGNSSSTSSNSHRSREREV